MRRPLSSIPGIFTALVVAALVVTSCARTAVSTSPSPSTAPSPSISAVATPSGTLTPGTSPTDTSPTGTSPTGSPTPSTPPTTQANPAPTVPADLRGKDVEAIPTSQKIVALTFDAGANADGLPSILGTLGGQHVPATFFLTGDWATRYPSSVKAIVAGGYRLGNHTVTHPHLTTMSDAAIVDQLTRARSQIMAAGGTDPRPLFRFPYGDRNAHTISVVNNAGYVAVRWTVDSLGWEGTSGGITTPKVIDRVVGAAKPGEIVLMHVGSNPTDHTTLDASALPTVIAKLKALGYGFVTLDALLSGTGVILPGCDGTPWRGAPILVTHQVAVPPVPVATGIRTGSHPECRYDRLVFDITGPVPGYEIRYVSTVTTDPADQPVTLAGKRYLLVTLHPAQGHSEAGVNTISPRSATLNYPMLKAYAVIGDFEGVLSVAIGLGATTAVRVGELSGRIYIDVAL